MIVYFPAVSHRRAALRMWKQTNGDNATYQNLIKVFERAGHRQYATAVRNICGELAISYPKFSIEIS